MVPECEDGLSICKLTWHSGILARPELLCPPLYTTPSLLSSSSYIRICLRGYTRQLTRGVPKTLLFKVLIVDPVSGPGSIRNPVSAGFYVLVTVTRAAPLPI
jgi:hypothetical protein